MPWLSGLEIDCYDLTGDMDHFPLQNVVKSRNRMIMFSDLELPEVAHHTWEV